MREHVHYASRRRDERLARVRKLSLGITGVAAAASLGLGTAFAHAIPGHAATSQSGTPVSAGTSSTAGGPATAGSANSGAATGGTHPASTTKSSATTGHHHQLAPPAQKPVSTQAAPVVSSGGS